MLVADPPIHPFINANLAAKAKRRNARTYARTELYVAELTGC
jgi:hypothetical protein